MRKHIAMLTLLTTQNIKAVSIDHVRMLATVFLLFSSTLTFSQEIQNVSERQCKKPVPGEFANACEAAKMNSLYRSKHLGDQWIDCEEMGGRHGTAGYGVAVFFAQEARPYWHEEIRLHLKTLEKVLPPSRMKRVKREQMLWERALPQTIDRAFKNTYGEEGTAAMYIGEANAMHVVRRRALSLACMVEQLKK